MAQTGHTSHLRPKTLVVIVCRIGMAACALLALTGLAATAATLLYQGSASFWTASLGVLMAGLAGMHWFRRRHDTADS